MIPKVTLTATAALAVCLVAAAKEQPPAGGEPREYRLPRAETVVLDNGLSVALIPFGKIPKATLSVSIQAGNLHERDDIWLADLAGQMLLQGAGGRDTDALAAAAANMGGEIGVGVGIDTTQVNLDVLSEFTADAIALLADVVRRPALPEKELARVRGEMLKNLAIRARQPQVQAEQAFRKRLFGEHPYGVGLPDPEEFAALDAADVRRFHAENFGAARTRLYVAGLFDRDRVLAAVRARFADWASGEIPESNPPTEFGEPGVTLIDRPGAPQSTLYLGVPVIDPNHPSFIELGVMNVLLGGSFSSRITSNIREDKGYTYSPRSNVVARVGNAYWLQTADITSESTGAALGEIFTEIRRLQGEAPDEAETAAIKNYRTGTFVLRNATRGGLIAQLRYLDTHGLARSYLTEYVGRINAVTPAQIQVLAGEHLPIDAMHLVIVGDLATVRPQLEPLSEIRLD